MRFEDEQYVRLYKRDTTTWLMLPWQGRAILGLILRKVDRAGILDLGEDGLEALAAHIQVPLDVVEPGMAAILKRGILLLRDDGVLVWPKFIDGQEAKQSDKARQKAARDRARDLASAAQRGVTVRDESVTVRDADDTGRDDTVTGGHAPSHDVTLSCAVLSCDQQIPPTPKGAVEPSQPPVVSEPRRDRFAESYWRATYERTVCETLGRSWGFPDKQIGALSKIVGVHCSDKSNADAWLAESVHKFVRAVRPNSQMWSAFGPDGMLRWLNAECPIILAPARPSATGAFGGPPKRERPRPERVLLDADPPDPKPTASRATLARGAVSTPGTEPISNPGAKPPQHATQAIGRVTGGGA